MTNSLADELEGLAEKAEGMAFTAPPNSPLAALFGSLVNNLPTIISALRSVEWRPISEAPRDGTVILGVTRNDMPGSDGAWSRDRWNGRYVPMRHEGVTDGGYDLGWSVALPVGHGGLPDNWFTGWLPTPPETNNER